MKLIQPLLFVFLMISSAMGQEVIQIHIDHGGLHCPHLGPKFKERFTELESVDSVYVDSENSIGTLYLKSGGELGDDQIRDVVVHKVGYPEPEIKAIIRNED